MESWYTKLFSMTLVKVKMHLEGLNGWNEIVKPKKLKVVVWQRKLESRLTFFPKLNKTCNYQYCKWWLYIISNQPQQPAVQINLILATHFGDGTDLRRSPLKNRDPLSPWGLYNDLVFITCNGDPNLSKWGPNFEWNGDPKHAYIHRFWVWHHLVHSIQTGMESIKASFCYHK